MQSVFKTQFVFSPIQNFVNVRENASSSRNFKINIKDKQTDTCVLEHDWIII